MNRPLPALLVLAVALRPKDGSRGPLWNGVTGTSVLGGEEDADLARQARGASTYTADAVAENAARREGAHRGLVARLLSPTAPGTQVVGEQTRANELGRHAALLRCLLGNPFGPVHVDPAWLRWNDGTVQKLAGVFGPDRRIELLPILADALEDAGCTEPYLLTHCREPIVHGRDCWVFKLLPGELAPG